MIDELEEEYPIEELEGMDKSAETYAVLPAIKAQALAAWKGGTETVRNTGYLNTAMYMDYTISVFRTPPTYTSNNNTWAKNVLFNNDILKDQYLKYKA